jgi:hypothetical protein
MIPNEFFHKCTCPSSDMKAHSKADHFWVGSRWQSIVQHLICDVSEHKKQKLGTEL